MYDVFVIDDNSEDLGKVGKILNEDGRYKAILAEGGAQGMDLREITA